MEYTNLEKEFITYLDYINVLMRSLGAEPNKVVNIDLDDIDNYTLKSVVASFIFASTTMSSIFIDYVNKKGSNPFKGIIDGSDTRFFKLMTLANIDREVVMEDIKQLFINAVRKWNPT